MELQAKPIGAEQRRGAWDRNGGSAQARRAEIAQKAHRACEDDERREKEQAEVMAKQTGGRMAGIVELVGGWSHGISEPGESQRSSR